MSKNIIKEGTRTTYISLEQGSDEWLNARCGLITASTLKDFITPAGIELSSSKKAQDLAKRLAAERASNFIERKPSSYYMERGHEDEIEAKIIYSNQIKTVRNIGFITEEKLGFKVGFSPDGVITDDNGLVEVKSRNQEFFLDTVVSKTFPAEHTLQTQFGLWVSGADYIDCVSICRGMGMDIVRQTPDQEKIEKILNCIRAFEEKIEGLKEKYIAISEEKKKSKGFFYVEPRPFEEEIF